MNEEQFFKIDAFVLTIVILVMAIVIVGGLALIPECIKFLQYMFGHSGLK